MDKFERLDFDGPKKEFIKNNLMFVIANSSKEQEKHTVQVIQNQGYKYSNNRYLRTFYHVALKNDPNRIEAFQKKAISWLDKTPRLKKLLKARLIDKPAQPLNKVSLEHLLSLSVNDFITQLYLSMLDRMPENEGFNSWQNAICSAMPKEAVIYSMSQSKEFHGRFDIENIKKYKNIYFRYRIKNILKRIPGIGYIISLFLMPKRIEQLLRSQSLNYENLVTSLGNNYNITLHRINEIQAFNHQFLSDFVSRTDETGKKIRSQISKLDNRISSINTDFERSLHKLGLVVEEGIKEIDISIKEGIGEINDIYEKANNNINIKLASINESIDTNTKDNKILVDTINTDIKLVGEQVDNESKLLISKLNHILHNEGTAAYLDMYNSKYEMELLKKSNISLFEKLIERSESIAVVGHYAREVFEDINVKSSQIHYLVPATIESILCCRNSSKERNVVPAYLHQGIEKLDKVIVLNSVVSSMLIMEDKLHELALKVKDELILVFDSTGNENLSVIWGDGFSDIEQSPEGEYFRWYHGAIPRGTIQIYNSTEYHQNCTITFLAAVLDKQAQLSVYTENERYMYNMEKGYADVIFNILLAPGTNTIFIQYFGKPIQPVENSRFLKFSVNNFSISYTTSNNIQTTISDFEAYEKQLSNSMCSIPSDEIVRRTLHQNGFFEVESLFSSHKLDSYVSNGLSRFYEYNMSYKYIKPHNVCNYSGLNIYIAKRRGAYNGDN